MKRWKEKKKIGQNWSITEKDVHILLYLQFQLQYGIGGYNRS